MLTSGIGCSIGNFLIMSFPYQNQSFGFTLIELLVCLVVASVIFGLVGLSISGHDRNFRYEAERLVQLFYIAQEESCLRGSGIRFELDQNGYRFLIREKKTWQVLSKDPLLIPRKWDGITAWKLQQSYGTSWIDFGEEFVISPFILQLSRGKESLKVISDGVGHFSVR